MLVGKSLKKETPSLSLRLRSKNAGAGNVVCSNAVRSAFDSRSSLCSNPVRRVFEGCSILVRSDSRALRATSL